MTTMQTMAAVVQLLIGKERTALELAGLLEIDPQSVRGYLSALEGEGLAAVVGREARVDDVNGCAKKGTKGRVYAWTGRQS